VIVPATAVVLPDGGKARWLGMIDLLELRGWAPAATSSGQLLERLGVSGLSPGGAEALLRWCARRRSLSASGLP